MGHIIPKLNLNRNPELVDNYGLVCAKNIRLLPDGTIGPDTAEVDIKIQKKLNDLLNEELNELLNENKTSRKYKIVGVIPYNTCFYLFVIYQPTANDLSTTLSYIVEYDEKTNDVKQCHCNWNSHYTESRPTKINGLCNVTLRNEIILNIAEYYENETVDKIPFKSINLAYSNESDDESIYTFAPNIPVTNITFADYYYAQIKTGMYVFYVRYEIKDGVYTNWFLASLPMYSAYFKTYNTIQGYVEGIDVNLDADRGFVLKIDNLFDVGNIKKFQLGFKASLVDGGVVARSWKTFDINTKFINFDYSLEDIEEIDISDLEKPVNQLYNVKNITNFKNKLYFSNYTEEDFNPDLTIPDDYVTIALKAKKFETRGLVINGTVYNDVTFEVDAKVATDKVISIRDHNDNLHREAIIDWFKKSVETVADATSYGYPFNPTVDFCFKFNSATKDEHTYDGQHTSQINIYIVISVDDYTQTDTFCINQGGSWNFTPTEELPNWNFVLDYDAGYVYVDGYRITNVIFEQIHPLDDTKYKIQRYNPVLTIIGNIVQGRINNNIQTLIPYQGYNFYIHFVKRNGVATNGYPIGSVYVDKNSIEDFVENSVLTFNDVNCIYPTFTFNKGLPDGYVGCFISMSHVKNLIVSLYTLHKNPKASINNEDTSAFADILKYKEAFDLDTLNVVENFGTIIDEGGNDVGLGTYYAGSDPTDSKTFGSSGKFYSPDTTAAYIKYPYDAKNDENIIYRATNYITYNSGYTYDNVTDVYLQGFFCIVTKPARAEFVQYIAGSTFYYKDYENDNYDIYIETDLPISHKWSDMGVSHPKVEVDLYTYFGIFSNYNNNFITIQETPQTRIKSYKATGAIGNPSRTRNILLIDSGNLYQIYSLNGAFKTKFTQVYKKENKYLVNFSNTIRSTGVLDEQVNTRYYLDDTEYYNVPTTKGIIINMKAIGNSIIVHTEDSMFIFSGANTLSAQGGEQIQLKEGNVFESGIREIFGSEYGFGGIQKYHHQISSENGYLFYDSDSKNMYVYQDNQQLSPISNSIKKLLKDVIDVKLASDYYNDRFFIKLEYPSSNNSNNNIVLSFNVKTKSFLSLHDINFDYAFNSKTLCYFVKDNNIYRKEVVYSLTKALVQPLYDNVDIFPIYTNANKTLAKPYIDIICNNDYDNVKVLDYVSWICKQVNNPYRRIQTNEFVETDDNSQLEKMNVAEEDEIDYPAQGILIYSNLTAKGTTYFKFNTVAELDEIIKENRRLYAEQGLYDATQRQYGSLKPRDMPYFQLGHWNYNYFRNDLDNDDVTVSDSYSDNKSLLYGNYFVVRLIFDVGVNFKLKDLMFAINNSYETRR